VKLTKVDELIRPQHFFLEAEDLCYFLREYTSVAGFTHGETNNIVSNLKKRMDRRGKPEWFYKERDILRAGRELRAALNEKVLQTVSIVPMPPSKAKGDPMYDDRVLRIAQEMTSGLACDVRELVLLRESMLAAHESTARPRPEDLYENLYVDEAVAEPAPARIVVLDDVLTAGAHYWAIKRRLRERFPGVSLIGMFYVRRAVPTAAQDFADFDPS